MGNAKFNNTRVIGERLAEVYENNSKTYYLDDHLGSSSVLVDEAGRVVDRISYFPFGDVRESGNYSKYGYNNKELDETGLLYYGARYYNPILKRWTQPDSVIQNPYDPQSLNRYAYTRNNPLKYIDPTGHEYWAGMWRAAEGMFSAVSSVSAGIAIMTASSVAIAAGAGPVGLAGVALGGAMVLDSAWQGGVSTVEGLMSMAAPDVGEPGHEEAAQEVDTLNSVEHLTSAAAYVADKLTGNSNAQQDAEVVGKATDIISLVPISNIISGKRVSIVEALLTIAGGWTISNDDEQMGSWLEENIGSNPLYNKFKKYICPHCKLKQPPKPPSPTGSPNPTGNGNSGGNDDESNRGQRIGKYKVVYT